MTTIVIHYKELTLKGRNRPWFIKALVRNVRRALSSLPVIDIRQVMGRLELDLGPDASAEEVRDRLRRLFGIANFAFARRGPLDLDTLAAAIVGDLGARTVESFRVSARRADKRFPLTSPQIERELGGRIKQAMGWRVVRLWEHEVLEELARCVDDVRNAISSYPHSERWSSAAARRKPAGR